VLFRSSLRFNLAGTKAYLGSNASLMILDALASPPTVTPNTNLKGKVLAVSPNGNKVMVSDTAGAKLYVFDTSSAGGIETFNVAGATAAAFAPDSFKAYVVAGNNLYVYIPGRILRPIALSAAAADVAFLPSGAFAYLAGSSDITARASCDDSLADTRAFTTTPLLVGAVPDASQVLAVVSSAIVSIVVTITPTGCPPGVTDVPSVHGFGQGAFTPQQLILTPDAKHAYVTSNLGVLLAYDVTAGVTSTIALSGGATQTFTGGATLDSNSVYIGVGVAAGANGVHRIDVATGADATAIPTPFLPDLVAVRPK